jgi:hypothetical protein
MDTYLELFILIVFVIIIIYSVHEIGRTKGHAEAYKKAKEQLKKFMEKK